MFKKEVKKLAKNKIFFAALLVIGLIPAIYSTIFLRSMLDPYGQMDKFPVAIVNQDKKISQSGKDVEIGNDLTNKLIKSRVLNLKEVSEKKPKKAWIMELIIWC